MPPSTPSVRGDSAITVESELLPRPEWLGAEYAAFCQACYRPDLSHDAYDPLRERRAETGKIVEFLANGFPNFSYRVFPCHMARHAEDVAPTLGPPPMKFLARISTGFDYCHHSRLKPVVYHGLPEVLMSDKPALATRFRVRRRFRCAIPPPSPD